MALLCDMSLKFFLVFFFFFSFLPLLYGARLFSLYHHSASTAPLHPDQKTVRKSLIPFSPYPSVQPQSDQSCFI